MRLTGEGAPIQPVHQDRPLSCRIALENGYWKGDVMEMPPTSSHFITARKA